MRIDNFSSLRDEVNASTRRLTPRPSGQWLVTILLRSTVADKKTTFENYRKEAERLLLWAIVQLGKPLSLLTHEDLQLFRQFLQDPQPRPHWVAEGGRKFPRHDPRWRPFYGALAASSQRQAMVIINALFAWLVEAGYLAGNPLSLSRQRTRRTKPRITRYLDRELWQEVKLHIDTHASASVTCAHGGCSRSSISAVCVSPRSAATRWDASSAGAMPMAMSAGGSK